MNYQELIPLGVELVLAFLGFVFLLGKYKVMFDHHEKILNQHEKQFERHEKQFEKHEAVIDSILKRVEAMNTEFTFMKGWISGKNQ